MRWIILVHRYLGIGLGLIMALWCLSGFVMMYVPYPSLSPAQRLQGLPPLDLSGCCTLNQDSLPDQDRVDRFEIEMLGSRPVLRLFDADGARLIDLAAGRTLPPLSATDVQDVAQAFARAEGSPAMPRLMGRIDYDQWTVSGEFNRERPLFEFALDDAHGTQLYVSGVSGKVVQVTILRQRIGNWFGAVPHWLYFAKLRRNTHAWSQIVDGLSVAGCFLVVIGLYVGLRQFLRRPPGHWSGYRGALFWHHVPGVFFGILLLSWVASGLISMNPWGFLDSDGGVAQPFLQAAPASAAQVRATLQWLPRITQSGAVAAVESAAVLDSVSVVATNRGGARSRFNTKGSPTAVDDALWARLSRRISPGGNASSGLLAAGDAYVYAAPGQPPQAVYRITGDDPQHTRYYFDPLTAELVAVFDGNARWYRWLQQGLHTLDFSPALRRRPSWDLLMIVLLTGVTTISLTGVYIGARHLWRLSQNL